MSVDELLAWNPGSSETWQLVDGVPHAMAPASTVHAKILSRLAYVIEGHLDARDSPCSALIEPGVMPHLSASHNLRVPDLAVTRSLIGDRQAVLTDPVMVAEILPPSNQSETWTNVWAYTTIPSVAEVLVLRSAFVGADLEHSRFACAHLQCSSLLFAEQIHAFGRIRPSAICSIAPPARRHLAEGAGARDDGWSRAGKHRAADAADGPLPADAAVAPAGRLDRGQAAASHSIAASTPPRP